MKKYAFEKSRAKRKNRKESIDKKPRYDIMIGMMKNLENEQLKIDALVKAPKTCAFSGHRELGRDFSVLNLKREIKKLIERGVETFYCGMAQGFDLTAGEVVLALKKKYENINLVACIPCENQYKYYSLDEKKRYAQILKKADETVVLSGDYYKGCMLARNRYMADRADVLICYCKKEIGGTAYTVNYFSKKYPLKEKVFL